MIAHSIMPRVLAVGPLDGHSQFAAAAEWLRRHTLLTTVTAPRGLATLSSAVEYDWVVMAAPRRGMFSHEQVEELQAQMPLARFVALLGTWCEGEVRSGRPWPGVLRLYWHEFVAWMESERVGGYRGLALPHTTSPTDRSLATRWTPRVDGGRVLVCTELRENYLALADACTNLGVTPDWYRPAAGGGAEPAGGLINAAEGEVADCTEFLDASPVRLGLWDAADWNAVNRSQLSHFVAEVAPARVIALMHFPRYDDHRQARRCGAAAVISKPLWLPALWSEVERHLQPLGAVVES